VGSVAVTLFDDHGPELSREEAKAAALERSHRELHQARRVACRRVGVHVDPDADVPAEAWERAESIRRERIRWRASWVALGFSWLHTSREARHDADRPALDDDRKPWDCPGCRGRDLTVDMAAPPSQMKCRACGHEWKVRLCGI
jgi:hypothetical protein